MTLATTHSRRETAAAALSLLVYLLLLAAIPLALWKLSGNPIPHHLIPWTEVQEDWRGIETQPSQIIYPLLQLLADVLWIVWAWNAAWTVIAFLWILLHLPRTALPTALAAITPAVAFRALSLGALVGNPTMPVHTATAATAPAAPAPVQPASAGIRTQSANPSPTVHIVEPGDNLWDLAQHYYHQAEDWHRIYDANRGVIQPDGHRLDDPALILRGWHLVIPGVPAPAASGSPAPSPAAARPAVTPPHGPTAAQQTPPRTPGRPAPDSPAAAPHTAPARNPGGAGRPAAERPHTVGYALPDDAGYVGITLIASVAAAVAILRTRNHRRGRPRDQDIPDLAQQLAAVHSLARSAQRYGFRAEDHPDQDVPPLYQPADGQVSIATGPDGRQETLFDPETLPGPLVLTGPGATDAARALAISTLATATHTLHTDPDLTSELLGTPTPPAQPENPAAGTTTVRAAQPETQYEPGTVVLGTPDHAQHATVIEVEHDGTVRHATGPAADRYTGTRIHTLHPEAATTLHHTLEDARPAPAGPDAEQNHTSTATEPAAKTEHGKPDVPDPAQTARDLATTPLILRVLGDPDVLGPHDTDNPVDTEQAAALLTILALHPDGIDARKLRALEWPETTDARRARLTLYNAMGRIRTRLRDALTPGPNDGEPLLYDKARRTYRLNPDITTTDLALARKLTTQAENTSNTEDQTRLLIHAASLYREQLTPILDDQHRDWLTTARYNLLNEATATHLRIAELTAPTQPDTAASHLTTAITLTPEDPHAVIAALRICRRMRRPDLAQTIYRKHTDALRPLGETPDPQTGQLLQELAGQHRRPS
jgi:DNA-binding SARP family transcriptional activator